MAPVGTAAQATVEVEDNWLEKLEEEVRAEVEEELKMAYRKIKKLEKRKARRKKRLEKYPVAVQELQRPSRSLPGAKSKTKASESLEKCAMIKKLKTASHLERIEVSTSSAVIMAGQSTVEIGESQSMATMDDLPSEIIEKIMSFMSLEDRKTARLVCKKWYTTSYCLGLIQNDWTIIEESAHLDRISPDSRHVNVALMNFSVTNQTPVISPFWERHGKDIRDMSFEPIEMIYPMLPHILSCCPNVENLILEFGDICECENAPDEVVVVPTMALPKLETLTIFNFYHMHQKAVDVIEAVFSNLPSLSTLKVFSYLELPIDQDRYTKMALSLVKSASSTLKELHLSWKHRRNDFFLEMIDAVGPQLTQLTAGIRLTDAILNAISEKCTNLETFGTEGTRNIFPVSIFPPSHHVFNRLMTCLRMSMAISLTGINLQNIQFSVDRMDNLVALDLSDTRIDAANLMAALAVPRPKLTKLNLNRLPCVNSEVLRYLGPKLPNLTDLYIYMCRMEEGMLEAICTFKKLRCLDLGNGGESDSPALIDMAPLNGLSELVQLYVDNPDLGGVGSITLPNLRWVRCDSSTTTQDDIQRIIEQCPLLVTIDGPLFIVYNFNDILEGRRRANKE